MANDLVVWNQGRSLIAQPAIEQGFRYHDNLAKVLAATKTIFHVVGGSTADNALVAELLAISLQIKPSDVYSADILEEAFRNKGLTSNPTFQLTERVVDEGMLRFILPFKTGANVVLVQHGAATISLLTERWRDQVPRAARANVGVIVVLPISHDYATQTRARATAMRVLEQGGGVLVVMRVERDSLFLETYSEWKQDDARSDFLKYAYTEIELRPLSQDILIGCDRYRLSLMSVVNGDFGKARTPKEAEEFFDEPRRDATTLWLEPRISKVRDAVLHVIARMYT